MWIGIVIFQNPLRKNHSEAVALSALEEPIRAELFSAERLEQHAESLAAAQRVTTTPRKGRPLLPRVLDNGRVLLESYRAIAQAIREERAITPAAEWLVDNYHIVDEQLREIRDDLPPGFYRELPKLAEGHLQGYPRVYGLAWAFVAHTDSRFDPEMLRRFVRAYQRVQPLTIGELWAVAITLRVVLVENLRRLAERIVHGRAARQEADMVADRLLGLGGRSIEPAATILRRFEGVPLATAFAVQLVQRLRDQDPVITPALHWLEEHLAAQGTTADEMVRARAPATGSDERDRAQCDHQYAPDLRLRLGGILRERQSWSTQYSGPTMALPLRTSRHAIVTGARSKNCRGVHSTLSLKLPDGRYFKRKVSAAKRKKPVTRWGPAR